MSDDLSQCLQALKIAFCYMPKAIEVNRYDHGDCVEKILADIEQVREALRAQGIDPEEVYAEINPGDAGTSCM